MGGRSEYNKLIVEENTYIVLKQENKFEELIICLHADTDYTVSINDDYMDAKHLYFESDEASELQYKKVKDNITLLGTNYEITKIESLWNYPAYYFNKQIMENPDKFGVTPHELKTDPVVDIFPVLYESEQREKEIILKYNKGIVPVYLMSGSSYKRYVGLFLQLLTDGSSIFKAGQGIDLSEQNKFILSYSSIILLHIFSKLETIDKNQIVIPKSTLQELEIIKKELKIRPEEDKLSIALDKNSIPVKYVSNISENIERIQTWNKMISYLSKVETVDTIDIIDNLVPYVKAIGKLEIDTLRAARISNCRVIIDDDTVQQFYRLNQINMVSNLIPFYFNFSSDSLLAKLIFIEQLSEWKYRFIIYPGFIEKCVEFILRDSNIILGENTVFGKFISLLKREIKLDYPNNINVIGFVNALKYLISHYLDSNSEKIIIELLKIIGKNTRNELENVLIQEYILHTEYKAFVRVCFKQVN